MGENATKSVAEAEKILPAPSFNNKRQKSASVKQLIASPKIWNGAVVGCPIDSLIFRSPACRGCHSKWCGFRLSSWNGEKACRRYT